MRCAQVEVVVSTGRTDMNHDDGDPFDVRPHDFVRFE